jgi:hypothetical protein
MRLTTRDQRLLQLLTTQVRVASDDQLARVVGASRSIRPRLRVLGADCLLRRASLVVARPPVARPLADFRPGDAAPDCGAIAWRLQVRWRTASNRRLTINWATARAARLFGGVGGRLRQPFQVAHDLVVTDVYLQRSRRDPSTGRRWLGEDVYRRRAGRGAHRKVPDAVLLDDSGEVTCALEIGGLYSARRLLAFHRHCRRRGWSYEIW